MNCVKSYSFHDLVLQEAKSTAKRRKMKAPTSVNRSTIDRIIRENDFVVVNAEVKSDPRLEAENDTYNTVSAYVTWKSTLEYVTHPELIINHDSTQVVFSSELQ